MKDTLKTLLTAFGPSGRERGIREQIEKIARPLVDEVSHDAMGNLICVKKGGGRRVMLAAHMDQIGFVVTDADKHGFLRVGNVGYIYRSYSLNRAVVFENGVRGVLSYEVEGDNPRDKSLLKLFVDIGAKTREEALNLVKIGDMAVYREEAVELAGGLMAAPAMDNRAGCALMLSAMAALKESPCELRYVFTTQEELGLRGAQAAVYGIAPDIGIALDVTPAGDTPKAERAAVKLGEGIAIKIMDGYSISSPAVVEEMEAAAERAGVPYQREVLLHGGTDASAMQKARAGVPVGTLSIPCRYVHSPAETVSLSDMEGGVKLLCALLSGDMP